MRDSASGTERAYAAADGGVQTIARAAAEVKHPFNAVDGPAHRKRHPKAPFQRRCARATRS